MDTPFEEILEIIHEFPEAAASVLLGKGVTPDELWNEIIDFEDADGEPWRPIMQ